MRIRQDRRKLGLWQRSSLDKLWFQWTLFIATMLFTTLSAGMASALESTTVFSDQPVGLLFFLYDDETPDLQSFSALPKGSKMKEECYGGEKGLKVSYWDTTREWYKGLSNHPWRTMSPEEATIFVVTFDFDQSVRAGDCNGESHLDRVERVTKALKTSKWFQRRNGRDHFWPIGSYLIESVYPREKREPVFPDNVLKVMSNMTVGHQVNWHQNKLDTEFWKVGNFSLSGRPPWWRLKTDWRCTVTVPVRTAKKVYSDVVSYEQWLNRETLVYFRGKGRSCSQSEGSQTSRDKVLELNGTLPNVSIHYGHAENHWIFGNELHASKFCLVMSCDDPLTSRFTDTLAAGCLPLVIDNGFRLAAAPFNRFLNYDSFTITVTAKMWDQDPTGAIHYILTYSESELERLYRGMLRARKHLLWEHPESNVATLGLAEIRRKCTTPGAPPNFPLE